MPRRKAPTYEFLFATYVVGTGQRSILDTVTAHDEQEARAKAEAVIAKLEPRHLIEWIKQNP